MKLEFVKAFRWVCVILALCAAGPAFGAGIQLDPNKVNFGEVALGAAAQKELTITNKTSSIVVLTLTPSSDPFFRLNTTTIKLGPNETGKVTVILSERPDAGPQSGSLLLSGNGVTKTVTVTAKVIDPFQTKIEPESLDFGSVAAGSSKELTLKIKNKTKGTLTYVFGVSSSQPFTVNPSQSTVAGGQAATVKVKFSPTFGQNFKLPVGIKAQGSAGSNIVAKMILSGIGTSPSGFIGLNPSVLDFGQVDRASGKQLSITVRNNSQNFEDFTVARTGNFVVATTPFSLRGGEEKTINVNVEAGVPPGNMTGTVTVTSGTTSGTINITASVFDVFGTELNPADLDFGTVNTGQTKSLTFSVKNTSPGALNYETTSNPSLYTGAPASLSLSPGQSGTFTITFNPGTAKGNLPGVVEVRAISGGNNSVAGSLNLKANVP